MKRLLAPIILFALIVNVNCAGMFGNMTGSNARSARDNAAAALETTADVVTALMVLAGAARDMGVWGPPGTPRADDVWAKISEQSIVIAGGLSSWSDALVAGDDTGPYQFAVSTAIAIITALMPPKVSALLDVRPIANADNLGMLIDQLSRPDSFIPQPVYGGAQ